MQIKTLKLLWSKPKTASAKYTLYTENKTISIDGKLINPITLTAKYFDGFFVSYGLGYYQGKQESSVKVEIVTNDKISVYALISDIKTVLAQESVLLTIEFPTVKFI